MTTTMRAMLGSSVLTPTSPLGLDLDRDILHDLMNRDATSPLLGGARVGAVMEQLIEFLRGKVHSNEAEYLACELAYGAQMKKEDLIKVCATQDAGYENDQFISTFWRGNRKGPEFTTGSYSTKETHVSYSLVFRRLIDDHKGHKFELIGLVESITRFNKSLTKEAAHLQRFNAFIRKKDGSWTTTKGMPRQIRDYILQRDR